MDDNTSLLTALEDAVTEHTTDDDSVLAFCQDVTNAHDAHDYDLVVAKLEDLNRTLSPKMIKGNRALGAVLVASVRGVETTIRLFLHVTTVTPLAQTEVFARIRIECWRLGSILDYAFGGLRIKRQFAEIAHHM